MATIYRFKIQNSELNDEMVSFSLYHLHETKEDLKESFQKWCQEEHIQSLILQEKKYLESLQYDLNKNPIETKIFKSIKYYHMKKGGCKPTLNTTHIPHNTTINNTTNNT